MGALGSRPAHSASTRQTTAGPYRWPWFLALSLLGTLAFGLAMYLKRLKGCTARIMPNYSAFRKRNRSGTAADNLKKRGWSWGCVSALDSEGRTIWIVDAHRDNGKCLIVRADEKLTTFIELEAAISVIALKSSRDIMRRLKSYENGRDNISDVHCYNERSISADTG